MRNQRQYLGLNFSERDQCVHGPRLDVQASEVEVEVEVDSNAGTSKKVPADRVVQHSRLFSPTTLGSL